MHAVGRGQKRFKKCGHSHYVLSERTREGVKKGAKIAVILKYAPNKRLVKNSRKLTNCR